MRSEVGVILRGGEAIMSFEFGVFHEFPRCAGQTDAEVFTQSFAQVDAAERWGLDVIWIAELHFLPERAREAVSYSSGSSPASARTSPRKDSMRWSIGFPAVPPPQGWAFIVPSS
jgi:hypothetical protein